MYLSFNPHINVFYKHSVVSTFASSVNKIQMPITWMGFKIPPESPPSCLLFDFVHRIGQSNKCTVKHQCKSKKCYPWCKNNIYLKCTCYKNVCLQGKLKMGLHWGIPRSDYISTLSFPPVSLYFPPSPFTPFTFFSPLATTSFFNPFGDPWSFFQPRG